jgi:heme exporter protein A
VHENLSFFARLHGLNPAAAEPLEERLGLAAKRASLAHTLSHGEARRLALARALLHDPELVIADEPFSGLDEASAAALPALLQREGRTLLIATHDVERGKAMADRILWLEGGRIRL